MSTSATIKRFAVVGNPVAHSRSPVIHKRFAEQTGIALDYQTLCSPLDRFAQTVHSFFEEGGSGLNITVPFKEEAYNLAMANLSSRAAVAGAVNTLWIQENQLHGCNTDGEGLLTDLRRLGHDPANCTILLIGAGGAARGVVAPLLEAGCSQLHIVNRNASRAQALAEHGARHLPGHRTRLSAGGLDEASGLWQIVINATSSSLQQATPATTGVRYAPQALAYDMVYGSEPTPFMKAAKEAGATQCADGLGMLVAQAAASFAIWNKVHPDIEPVLEYLRAL